MERAPGKSTSARPRAGQDDASLPAVRTDFPRFRIWRETVGNRTRYIARSLHQGTRPHTVVTADLAELRAHLSAGHDEGKRKADRGEVDAPRVDSSPASTARRRSSGE
jgi:hypothetical protein